MAGKKEQRKRFLATGLKVTHLAACASPAQEGALAVLMKRRDEEDAIEPVMKRWLLLSDEKGHSHLLDDSEEAGTTSSGVMDTEEYGHSHPWSRDNDGAIRIGAARGHTHAIATKSLDDGSIGAVYVEKATFTADQRRELARRGIAMEDGSYPIRNASDLQNAINAFGRAGNKAAVARHIGKRARALGMSDRLPTSGVLAGYLGRKTAASGGEGTSMGNDPAQGTGSGGGVENEVAELQKRLERAEALAGMTDVEKAHLATLEGEAAEGFLKAKPEARAQMVENAEADDPVVYKADDGTEYRQSDDSRLREMAKRADQDRRELRRERETREREQLEKRAGESLAHLPGSIESRAALLQAAEGIQDEAHRKAALEILKAANDGAHARRIGTSSSGDPDSDPSADVEKRARQMVVDGKAETIEKATQILLETDPLARQAYEDSVASMRGGR